MAPEKKAPETLRELMPIGYTRKLMKATGCLQRQTMCDIVLTAPSTGRPRWRWPNRPTRSATPCGRPLTPKNSLWLL
jgi:hypothetical protein